MSLLPVNGGDNNTWGIRLLNFLAVSFNSDGTLATAITLGPSNGTDDTAMIQAAINAAAATVATGGRAVVVGRPGVVYKLSYTGPVVTFTSVGAVHSALQIKPGVFLQNVALSSPDYSGTQVATIVDDGVGFANWGVDRCQFNGNAARGLNTEWLHEGIMFASSSDVWITRNQFTLFRQSAILAIATSTSSLPTNVHIKDNKITLCQGGAIKLDKGCTDVWITDNEILNNTGIIDGTYAGAEQIYLDDTTGINTRVRIVGNILINWGSCVVLGSGHFVDVVGNYMSPPTGGSCFSVESNGPMTYCRICDNMLVGSTNEPAIQPYISNHLLIKGNVFVGQYTNPVFINETGASTANLYTGNVLGVTSPGTGRPTIDMQGTSTLTVVRGNIGDLASSSLSPMALTYGATSIGLPGAMTVTVPASGTAVAAFPTDRTFYVTAGASTVAMAILGGATVTVPSGGFGAVRVPAALTVTPTYSSAPTWVVEAE